MKPKSMGTHGMGLRGESGRWVWPRSSVFVAVLVATASLVAGGEAPSHPLARHVEIIRDAWGVAHVRGKTDAATLFGMGYAQAEDYFWQVEDNVIRAIGRYAEAWGKKGLKSDLLNHQFEVVTRAQADWQQVDGPHKLLAEGFVAGVNYYLATHPHVVPRLITTFEPWHVLCVDRHFLLDFTYARAHVPRDNWEPLAESAEAARDADARIRARQAQLEHLACIPSWLWPHDEPTMTERAAAAAIGSNQWALAGSRTKSNCAMLLLNPHQPFFGWGQYYEAHLQSDETLNFSGAGFYGMPIPSKGHNDHQLVAVQVSGVFHTRRAEQAVRMIQARDFEQWYAAVSIGAVPMFNIAYADRAGNIFYVYNGCIPRRDPQFEWTGLVDGTSYLAAIEFTPRVTAASAVQFGASSHPRSKHYFDQANCLLSADSSRLGFIAKMWTRTQCVGTSPVDKCERSET